MRSIRVRAPGGLDKLELAEAEAGSVGAGEIRVRLHASSLNYHDYLVVSGGIPTPDGRIPMSDGAGDVVEVGSGVTEFRTGDHVMSMFFPGWLGGEPTPQELAGVPGDRADGYACEEIVAAATAFTRAPAGYSHVQAASLPCAGTTVWRSLFVEGRLQPGDSVLVQGTGGVSIFALQFAKAAGAEVIATSSSDEKLERLRALGADHLINYKADPNWGQTARRMTGGRGVDHVVEIGGAGTLAQSIAACRFGGHIGLIGVLAGYSGDVSTVAIMGGNVRVTGLTVGSRKHQIAMVRAVEATGLKPVIDRVFPLEEIASAFYYQETGQHLGKIALAW